MNNAAIITAAGAGNRFGELKQFKRLNGQPLDDYSLRVFVDSSSFNEIILVVPSESQKIIEQEVQDKYGSLVKVVIGGINRPKINNRYLYQGDIP